MSTRVLLADDHKAIRKALRVLIEDQVGLDVVGEAEDGRAAVNLAVELSPDLVLMDVSMPVMDGIEATRRIASEAPGIKVLGLSMHAEEKLVREMLQAGASGYVLKDQADKELADAIRAITAGRGYLSPAIGNLDVRAEGLTGAQADGMHAAGGRTSTESRTPAHSLSAASSPVFAALTASACHSRSRKRLRTRASNRKVYIQARLPQSRVLAWDPAESPEST